MTVERIIKIIDDEIQKLMNKKDTLNEWEDIVYVDGALYYLYKIREIIKGES